MVTDTTIKKRYKQTEIGVIPEDWKVKKLGEVAEIKKGQLITDRTRINGSIPVIAGGKAPAYYHDKANRRGKTITVSGSGANAGYVAFYTRPIFASDCSTIEESKNYSIEFIYFLLQSLQEEIYKMQTGGAQPHIHPSDLNPIMVAVPKSEEQTVIATVLSDTDALIEHLEKLIAKKKAIKQGTMQQLLTGKKRLPGFGGKWEVTNLGKVAEFVHGRGLSKSDLDEEGTCKCIHYGQLFTTYKELIQEVNSRTNKNDGCFYSQENDVLMPTSDVTPRGLATASCIKETGVILGGGILVIRLHPGYDGLYFSYFVTQNKISVLKLVKGSTVFHLYANDLATLEVCFPNFQEQIAIARVLSDMDAEIESLEQKRDKYVMLKQGMMRQLLTGTIQIYANN